MYSKKPLISLTYKIIEKKNAQILKMEGGVTRGQNKKRGGGSCHPPFYLTSGFLRESMMEPSRL
jgi:hypothetical protein